MSEFILPKPRADLSPNTLDYETTPQVKATGFREYDARWLFGPEINLLRRNRFLRIYPQIISADHHRNFQVLL